MKTNVGLQALGKSFKHRIHINAICIRPSVLEIFLQTLSQRIWYLENIQICSQSIATKRITGYNFISFRT